MKKALTVGWFLFELIVNGYAVFGGQPCYNGYCRPQYHYKPYVAPAYKAPAVTVVNNLIGIPVPVPYVAPIAEQGKTVYGYSLSSYKFAEPIDFNLYFTQSSRLLQQAQQFASDGHKDMNGTVQLAIEGSSKIAEYAAKRDAVVAAFKASEPTEGNISSSLQLRITKDAATGKINAEAVEEAGTVTPNPDLLSVLRSKCLTCHNGTKVMQGGQLVETEHGIDIGKYVSLKPEHKELVMDLIDSDDPDKRMPKGGRLNWKEKAVFLGN